MNKQLDELITSGRIKPSKSPLASLTFFVGKKNGKLRMVVDYRKLNDITIKNSYPIPLIPELVHKWKGCKQFTKLDVHARYHNIRIKPGDEWKTAFMTHHGLFQWRVMPFGMCNAPATFQNMMNDIFIVHIRRGDTDPYIDDVLIGTASDPKGKLNDDKFHKSIVHQILKEFRQNKLYLKAEKCFFSQKSVKYLGTVVNGQGSRMDPEKIKAIIEWPTPSTLTQLHSFLGFLNFYQGFINDFS